MKKYLDIFFLLLCLSFVLCGCAHKGAPTEEQITAQGEKLNRLARSKTVEELDVPYLGGRAIPIANDSTALGMRVTLRQKGSLSSIATTLSDMIRIPIQVATVDPEPLDKKSPASGKGGLEDLLALPSSGSSAAGGTISVSYEGTLRGLLDSISTQSGFGWDYNSKTNSITFARFMIRTFTLLSAPGEVNYSYNITNKSKESQAGNLGNSTNINNTVSTADTSAQTAQTSTTKLKFDVWKDTEANVKMLLSKEGSVTSNQASGTITVRDRPENVRQITAFIDQINSRLGKQVAINVQVWSLELTQEAEAGLDLQLMFANKDVSVVAGSLSSITGSLNTATATIVSGKLKNSAGVLKALSKWGNASQVTSGGGLAMNNQSVPVVAVKRTDYLASASMNTTQYGQTAQITPGEVTTGFAMTVVPHILDNRRVILQYDINLSSLDKMEEFKTQNLTLQLPHVSTRAFAQRTRMQMGQTLVLAGYQQVSQGISNGIGLFSASRSGNYGKTLLVITIQTESANDTLED